jgi:hypothetical protein
MLVIDDDERYVDALFGDAQGFGITLVYDKPGRGQGTQAEPAGI